MRRLILRSFQSPGDVVMLTAAVRDLHAACPGQFVTDVRTSADALWLHNPHITRLEDRESDVHILEMHYPLIHHSNQRPYHFIHGYAQFLEEQLGVRVPVMRFHGEVYLSDDEKLASLPAEWAVPDRYWIMVAGGKFDFTAKWWAPAGWQAVVDHFRDKLHFVQCGEEGHWHRPLQGVTNLVGRTSLREFIRLMHRAEGVVCPVTFAMHLAAAVEMRSSPRGTRPCVVIAGGREPAHWEAYPNHQFLSTNGALSCCLQGGCWKSRCQLVGDGDPKDRRDLCQQPVQVAPDLRIPRCMDMITPVDVIRRIELYFEGDLLSYDDGVKQPNAGSERAPYISAHQSRATATNAQLVAKEPPVIHEPRGPLSQAAQSPAAPTPNTVHNVLVRFRHGLGDAVQFTIVLKHIRQYRPEWHVDVAALVGKHSAYHGLCRQMLILDHQKGPPPGYDEVYSLDWHECRTAFADCPSTKPARCLSEVFGISPSQDLFRYEIRYGERARTLARKYLAGVCPSGPDADGRFPAVLIHYQGNTSGNRKDLPHDLARDVCEVVLHCGAVPVILDWDRRSALVDGKKIHNPGAEHELWHGIGPGDAESLAALIDASRLLIGVDSGPLHVAGATHTQAIGVWTQHHPVHYFDLAENVFHFVPGDHEKHAAGPQAVDYFRTAYHWRTYKQLHIDLPALVHSRLSGEDFEAVANKRFLKTLTAYGFDRRYYDEHKAAGLDYLGFGDWQRQYGRWLVESLELKGKRVLDVGCACGAILRGLGEAGAIVHGVDLNEHAIQLGREKWPDMASLLFTCDAVNLHLYANESWDAVHTAQVAEHWKPELVPHILREFWRVVVAGGLLFCALDTEELLTRQARERDREDPTHHCIRPLVWWHQQLADAGWEVCSAAFEPSLRQHPESFLKRYDWDWFVARRTGSP
jgi:ADP-heptose:LPS heptosyltransferase/2-polyprenyl-3-methyl-5-hydroxy-6-metoxy-1,4-benzoquinol methylase